MFGERGKECGKEAGGAEARKRRTMGCWEKGDVESNGGSCITATDSVM